MDRINLPRGRMKAMKDRKKAHILWFNEISIKDVPLVGGKNASLGEMLQSKDAKVKIPPGFAITAAAYKYFLEKGGALKPLKETLCNLNIKDPKSLETASKRAQKIILDCDIPEELEIAIASAYQKLCKQYKTNRLDVAVRSSATAEDLPSASFAGMHESFLNISSLPQLIKACKKCFASLFTKRALVYRIENKFDHFKVYLSIGVQKMVRSDLASAGVIFTLDTETGFSNVVFITGSYGLGESVVQGAVNPDEFYVFKPTLMQGFKPIIDKRLGSKATKIIYSKNSSHPIKKIKTNPKEREKFWVVLNM